MCTVPRVHKTTHISSCRRKKEIQHHDCIGPCCSCGWVRVRKEAAESECIDAAHSFDSRFSHAGLASLFITNFRVKKSTVHIFYDFFSSCKFDTQKYQQRKIFHVFTHSKKAAFFSRFRSGHPHTTHDQAAANFCRPADANLQPASSFFSLSF